MTAKALMGIKGRQPPPAARVGDVPFEWDDRKRRAALLFAEGSLPLSKIAHDVNIDRPTLWRWLWRPEFQQAVEELELELNGDAFRLPISRRRDRLHAYNERRERLLSVVAERAAWYAEHEPEVPGGSSGYLVRRLKVVGTGPTATAVPEYEVDTSLVKALGELEKQAAIETGEWAEKVEVDATVAVQAPALTVSFRLQRTREELETDATEASFREVPDTGG